MPKQPTARKKVFNSTESANTLVNTPTAANANPEPPTKLYDQRSGAIRGAAIGATHHLFNTPAVHGTNSALPQFRILWTILDDGWHQLRLFVVMK